MTPVSINFCKIPNSFEHSFEVGRVLINISKRFGKVWRGGLIFKVWKNEILRTLKNTF